MTKLEYDFELLKKEVQWFTCALESIVVFPVSYSGVENDKLQEVQKLVDKFTKLIGDRN